MVGPFGKKSNWFSCEVSSKVSPNSKMVCRRGDLPTLKNAIKFSLAKQSNFQKAIKTHSFCQLSWNFSRCVWVIILQWAALLKKLHKEFSLKDSPRSISQNDQVIKHYCFFNSAPKIIDFMQWSFFKSSFFIKLP